MTNIAVTRSERRSELLTLAAFVGVVVFGGTNFVAAYVFVQDLPPLFGAALRFGGASLLFFAFTTARRVPFPTGSGLVGAVLFGLLLGLSNGLGFWAIPQIGPGPAALIMAAVPLLTLFFARAHHLEGLTWRGLVGGGLTIAGIAALRSDAIGTELPLLALLAAVGAAACAAEAGVVVKRLASGHPAVTNGIGMAVGTVVLLGTSGLVAEQWAVPRATSTWLALAHLVVPGAVGVFGLYLFILRRWTASASAYSIVLMPVVAAPLGALLAGQPIHAGFLVGGAIVLAGVYVGALSRPKAIPAATAEDEALAQRCATC